MHDHVDHVTSPKVLKVKRKLGTAAGVDSGVGALSRSLFERLTDDEFVRSVVLTRDAKDVFAQVCRGRQAEAVGGLLNAFAVETRPSVGANRNVPFNDVFNTGIRFASYWAEEAVYPLVCSIPKSNINRRKAG